MAYLGNIDYTNERKYCTQEEFEELNKLIEDNKRLIEKYPEKLSLKIGLQSLETRKRELLKQIKTF